MRTGIILTMFAGLTIGVGYAHAYNDVLNNEPAVITKPAALRATSTLHKDTEGLINLYNPVASKIVVNASAYTANQESTGKYPGHADYGRTTSGDMAATGITIAASRDIPFGTKVYIPYFDGLAGWDNNGIFVVQDRGGAITPGHVDIFFGYDGYALQRAYQFGRQQLDMYILKEGVPIDNQTLRRVTTESTQI